MNFWDLCVACWQAIVRFFAACWRVLSHMLRLTYRYWWLVITLVILAVAAAFYYTRYPNVTYCVNAIALLNGPTVSQFEQTFAPLRSQQLLPPGAPIGPYLYEGKVTGFDTYRVIDCRHDETPDYVDFAHRSTGSDTSKVQMQDRLCVQFRIKVKNMALVPEIEEALLATLNADPAFQQAYSSYLINLREEAAFNHRQAQKLDSLTSSYCYSPFGTTALPGVSTSTGVAFYGDRKIRLFLDQIYRQHEHMQRVDHRLQMAVAPITLENHFAVDPKPVNGRMKCVVLFFILGWCGACLLAEIIDKRKALIAWLRA